MRTLLLVFFICKNYANFFLRVIKKNYWRGLIKSIFFFVEYALDLEGGLDIPELFPLPIIERIKTFLWGLKNDKK